MTSFFLLLWACATPCEYTARCDGSVLQTCFLGPDQLFGSGESEIDCASTPNPVCHEEAPDVAFCVLDQSQTCEPGTSRCDGDLAITCNSRGFDVAEDCTDYGPTCVLDDEQVARCALDPLTPCDGADFETRCDGDALITCSNDLERRLVCDDDRTCGVNAVGNVGCIEVDPG